jgi:tRNA-dihydrouridine synthase B
MRLKPLHQIQQFIKMAAMQMQKFAYSQSLREKLDAATGIQAPCHWGGVDFLSPYLLAPMSNISHAPFRYLMQELGSGGSISELISCHGIMHGNEKTLKMLRIGEHEKSMGIQLFGECPESMAKAAKVAETFHPSFIDINMGCPVRKVVTKGAGSALLQKPQELKDLFHRMLDLMNVPLSIKIRTGWDSEHLNADEVIGIAKDAGVCMVSIHGRTRAQKYEGRANWDYIDEVAKNTDMPIIGNGDLIDSEQIRKRYASTNCQALMIGRGALRNPFLFLEIMNPNLQFTGPDYIEIIHALHSYLSQSYVRESFVLIQLKKFTVWFSAGCSGAAKFRSSIFPSKSVEEVLAKTEAYFLNLPLNISKHIDTEQGFLMSGHG